METGVLAEMKPDMIAYVTDIRVQGSMAERLHDLGLVPGTKVRCRLRAPAGSPIAYEFRGTVIALRKTDASQILCRWEGKKWEKDNIRL